MAAKSYTHDNNVINFFLRANPTGLTSPATVYVGLFTVAPTPGTAGTECSGVNYARVAVTFALPSNGVTQNSGVVTFPAAGAGGWGTVVAAGIFDSLAGGTLLYFGNLTASKTIDELDVASFANATLSITEQ